MGGLPTQDWLIFILLLIFILNPYKYKSRITTVLIEENHV